MNQPLQLPPHTTIKRGQPQIFPVVCRPNATDCETLGIKMSDLRGPYPSMGMAVQNVHAMATGEKRPPKRGEWYLSGAFVEAYRAPNDLSTAYHIARLVLTATATKTEIVKIR